MLNKKILFVQCIFILFLNHCGDPIESCDINIKGIVTQIKEDKLENAKVKINDNDNCCAERDKPCIYKTDKEGYWKLFYVSSGKNDKCSVTISKEGYISKTEEYEVSCPKPLEKVNIELETVLEAESGTCINSETSECTEVPEADCGGDNLVWTAEATCPAL